MLALFLTVPPSVNAVTDPLLQLLQHKHCAQCNLNDADLVHADLRKAKFMDGNCGKQMAQKMVQN